MAKAAIQPDSTFRLETPVTTPRQVYFDVLDGVGHEGQRFAVVNDQSFVVEPGHLRLQMDERAKFVIEGGLYNDAGHTEPLGGIYADVDTCGEVHGPGRYGTGGGAIRLPRLKT